MRMKKSVVLPLILSLFFMWTFLSQQVSAQTRARTESGKEVILYPDGTWKYAKEPESKPSSMVGYNKLSSANKLFKPARGEFGIWYNESKWRRVRVENEREEGKVTFYLIGEDGYAMVISEGIEMPTSYLKEVVLGNARNAGADFEIILEEKRIVNDREVLCLQMAGTIMQVPFVYYGYFHSGKEGTIQVITYTGKNLLKKYEQEFTDFLNGLVISP